MKILELLENKLGVKFEGTTGNDLKEYIISNGSKLNIGVDLNELFFESEEFDNKAGYFIQCSRKVLQLVKSIIVSKSVVNVKTGEEYADIAAALRGTGRLFNLRLNFDDQGEYKPLVKVLNVLKKASVDSGDEIKLYFNSQYPIFNQWLFDVYKGYNRQSFVIYTNGTVNLLNSYLELASRCNDGNLEEFCNNILWEVRETYVETINDYYNID